MNLPYKSKLKKRIKLVLKKTIKFYKYKILHNSIKVKRFFFRDKTGINLIGYFSSTFGVAEVARFFAKQAMQVHIPFSITCVYSESHKSLSEKELIIYQQYFNSESHYYKTIFFINADLVYHYNESQPKLFLGRYNAAVFFWEFNDYFYFPNAFKVLNEAIAFTDFIATAIRKSAPEGFKVTKLNFPFVKNWEITQTTQIVRNKLSIEPDDFVFFFNFDFLSIYERKNPEAILKALETAFGHQDKIKLITKTIHAEQQGQNFDKFQLVLKGMKLKDKVIMINDSLERNEMMSMINAADSYISLHRSEGLGLGMMEAMSMGKPIIATGFGGNLDFMNEENSLLVDYKLVPLQQDELPYKKGWIWAEPDIQMAATYMRKLYDDRNFAITLGKKGQNYIESKYNSVTFSKELQAWLHQK